ncbi:MAG: class I SAM-dependent methyltransferase [Actinomycetota bacterium]
MTTNDQSNGESNGHTSEQADAIGRLREVHPWPNSRPDAPVSQWGWGVGGADLLRSAIPDHAATIVEIGSLLGGSARFFCEHWPNVHVVCVDPWVDVDDPADRPFLEHAPELTSVILEADGIHRVFLASNWELRDRITPIRAFSPEGLVPVHAAGIEPDVVYVDGSHVYEDVLADIVTARALFPDALLCGDDWNWPGVHQAVRYVADNRGGSIRTEDNTWVLDLPTSSGRQSARSAHSTGRAARSLPVRVAEGAYRGVLAGAPRS